MQGTIKWFSKEKGYGFINSGEQDYYFNVQSIKGADLPSTGDVVEFDSKEGSKNKGEDSKDKGPKAINVVVTTKSESNTEKKTDDRVNCPNCSRKIVPRVITGPPKIRFSNYWTPEPKKSVCPYCASTIAIFGSKSELCFIATAVYGNANCYEVTELRKFRDKYLLSNPIGERFVNLYYSFSPNIAEWLKRHKVTGNVVKSILNKVVGFIQYI